MNYSIMTERETEIELSTNSSEGLSSFTAHDRLIEGGRNLPEKTYSVSPLKVVLSQFKNLYTSAFFVMGLVTALLDFKGSLGACILFFAVAALNMVSGFLRDNRKRQNAVKFDTQRGKDVTVIRDGKEVSINPTLLVRGDIVVLKEGDMVPADLRILKSENLKADESIYGNSHVPKKKKSERMENEATPLSCDNVLYTGSIIVHGSAVGAVIATGKDTAISAVVAGKEKNIKKHNKFAKNALSEKILLLGAILCAMFVFVYLAVVQKDAKNALLTAFAISLCLLPAPIYTVRLLAEKFFVKKLLAKGVEFLDNDCVKKLSEAEFLLFDKGGILTNGEMELEETVISDIEKLEMAVICSDCEVVGEKVTGSSIDMATFREGEKRGIDPKRLIVENKKILYMPFDEDRKLMAVLVRRDEGYRLIVKGSVEVVPTLCISLADNNTEIEMSGEVMHRLETVYSSMAEKGLKIRAVAYRDIDFIPENIEDEIKSLIFAGAFGYREIMAKNAKESIKKIESVYVKPIMVTGDHTITAAALAKMTGLIKKEKECISFRELADCTDKELFEAAKKYKVFSCASGKDRERLVKVISQRGYITVVAGEQMTEDEVSIYANVSLGDGARRETDVLLKNENIEEVADVLFHTRTMRGNMSYASLLGVSLGMAETLTLLWMMFCVPGFTITSFNMLVLNLLVVCASCFTLSLFARVKQMVKNRKMLAIRAALQAIVCALFAIVARENMMMYFILYALLEAGRVCASFKNLEKGKPGGQGLIVTLIVTFIVIVAVNSSFITMFSNEGLTAAFAWACLAVVINAVLSYIINLKGIGNKNV